jgi:electron transfer flavoprotein alpha subunit
MDHIFVITEQRNGVVRDGTFESLAAAQECAEHMGAPISAIVLGDNIFTVSEDLGRHCNRVAVLEHEILRGFNSDAYERALLGHLRESQSPFILVGHTAFGIELAPALSVALNLPLLTDCIGFEWQGKAVRFIRQMFSNKLNARFSCNTDSGAIVTLRPGAFPSDALKELGGEVARVECKVRESDLRKRFVGYEEAPVGDVDISQADIIVAVGRGLDDVEHLPMVASLAEAVGGVVACSRPLVDKKWMPKFRQVGTSGATVRPKVYIAIGISGAFQHIGGIKGSPLIIAINKDPKAPIFRVADYGVVSDLYEIVPLLEDKIKELRR